MLRSLELRWLARHDRDIPLPEVLFASTNQDFEGKRCGGCFYTPKPGEFLYRDAFIPFERGVILVGTEDPEVIPGIIAHEWRHCWQFHRGLLRSPQPYNPDEFSEADTYDSAIRKYFRTQRQEMDALLYQFAKHPDWSSKRMVDATFREGA
jgi:hypothetical protein